MTIKSADEFLRLRTSTNKAEYSLSVVSEASIDIWMEIIEKYPEMRRWVALNKTAPLAVLEMLAKDQSRDVRFSVAMVRRLSAELFMSLSRDPDEGVRHGIACNKKVPIEILEFLTHDSSQMVREAASEHLESLKT